MIDEFGDRMKLYEGLANVRFLPGAIVVVERRVLVECDLDLRSIEDRPLALFTDRVEP